MSWVNMELDDEEQLDMAMPLPMERPRFPCGLCLSFEEVSIGKLGLEKMPSKEDLLDMRCMMLVTNVSDGPTGRRFEAQITLIKSPVENEDTEMNGDGDEPVRPKRRSLLYGVAK